MVSYELSSSAKALLAKQRAAYVGRLGEKKERIRQLFAADLARPEHFEQLIDVVHRLAGSAGLHQLTELQHQASRMETALRQWNGADQEEITPALQQLLDSLENVK